jgi:WD40 repeat protein
VTTSTFVHSIHSHNDRQTTFLRSLLAHEDSVTSVKFQPETHYFFSCGKDGVVKYWDADR